MVKKKKLLVLLCNNRSSSNQTESCIQSSFSHGTYAELRHQKEPLHEIVGIWRAFFKWPLFGIHVCMMLFKWLLIRLIGECSSSSPPRRHILQATLFLFCRRSHNTDKQSPPKRAVKAFLCKWHIIQHTSTLLPKWSESNNRIFHGKGGWFL